MRIAAVASSQGQKKIEGNLRPIVNYLTDVMESGNRGERSPCPLPYLPCFRKEMGEFLRLFLQSFLRQRLPGFF